MYEALFCFGSGAQKLLLITHYSAVEYRMASSLAISDVNIEVGLRLDLHRFDVVLVVAI